MTLAQINALLPPEAPNSGHTRRIATGTGSDLIAMAKMGGN